MTKYLSWFFLDKQGRQTLARKPNIPLLVWLVASILGLIFTTGTFASLLSILAFGFLFTWAWLEITQGESPFRRVLGAGIMVLIIVSRV